MLVAFTFLNTQQNKNVYRNYIEHFINEISSFQKEHQFLLIANHLFFSDVDWNKNITVIKLAKSLKILQNLSEKLQFKKIIKQQQPEIIIHFSEYVNTNDKIPQIVFLQEIPTKKEILQLAKAEKIIVNNHHFKNELLEKFHFREEQIEVLYPQPKKIFQPLDLNEVSAVKDGYADGREYFLFVQNEENLEHFITILKAFSEFKKWQKSSMKLLIVSRFNSLSKQEKEKLTTYKFKDDVVILENLDEVKYSKIIATAYAVIYSSSKQNSLLLIFEILQSQTPLIINDFNSFKEIANDAALYFEQQSFISLSEKMQSVYKDENLRNSIISKAQEIANKLQKTNPTEIFWQTIAKATTD